MKKIYFDNLQNMAWLMVMLLALIFVLVGMFDVFAFENPKWNGRLSAIGFALQAFYFLRLFWYRRTFQWNKKGAVIRLGSFWGKNLSFNEVKATELTEKNLTVIKFGGERLVINIEDIDPVDVQKLNEIILKHRVMRHAYQ